MSDIDYLLGAARYIIANHPSKDTLTGTLETMGKLADALSAAHAEIAVLRGPDSDERDGLITAPIIRQLAAAHTVIEEAKAKLAEDGHDGSGGDIGCEAFAILSKFPSGEEDGR